VRSAIRHFEIKYTVGDLKSILTVEEHCSNGERRLRRLVPLSPVPPLFQNAGAASVCICRVCCLAARLAYRRMAICFCTVFLSRDAAMLARSWQS